MDWNNKQQRERFLQGLAGLCELHNRQATEAMAKLYFFALQQFEIEDVLRAMVKAVTASKFFPRPAEIIEFIQGNPEDVAEVEASKVLEAVKRVGAYKSVVFDNPVTAAVIEHGFGGWVKLCSEMRADSEKWFRKDFCKLYVSFSRQDVRYFGELAGRAAIANEANCTPNYEQVALIGNAGKAQNALTVRREEQLSLITMLANDAAKHDAAGA
ncbi:DUF6475 domain-containing protein [Halodesulfovibrio aestuarii]|uniref:DUF6475 domain-containing protein n=1 Tax=Halodesulfovibrio aestuarii TaxID=126333 RepID=A0A8G2C8J4_9BACT|nr:DUF6475 domain-containing protein [Halodesulfovibrio aestuarii]SHI82600.1 hypothetical protein SAMN05660830_01120 [Halodesulfovibrio aestuarii]